VLDFEGLTDWLALTDASERPEARRRAGRQLQELEVLIGSRQRSGKQGRRRSQRVEPLLDLKRNQLSALREKIVVGGAYPRTRFHPSA